MQYLTIVSTIEGGALSAGPLESKIKGESFWDEVIPFLKLNLYP